MNLFSHSFRTVRWRVSGFVAVLLATQLFGVAPAAGSESDDIGPYFLFDGAEITAKHEGVFQRVVGVSRRSLELQLGTETEVVPIRQLQGYRTIRATKFSPIQANIEKMRAASLRIALDRRMAELEFGVTSSIRQQESALAMDKADLMISQMALGPRATDAARQTQIEEKSGRIENLRDVMDDYASDRADDLERDAAAIDFEPASVRDLPFEYEYDSLADGLEFKCVISTPHTVEDGFLAVTVRYVDVRQPLKKLQALELHSVGRVGKKPRKVTVEVRNLPQGFHLIGCTLNFYARGQEVATNLSKNQSELNATQLYQHFLGEYLTQNRGATRPPGFMLLAPRDQLRRKLKAAGLQQDIFAKIDPSGGIISLSTDEAETREASPPIHSVMRFVRFFPGLREGNAVESRVKLKLSDLLE